MHHIYFYPMQKITLDSTYKRNKKTPKTNVHLEKANCITQSYNVVNILFGCPRHFVWWKSLLGRPWKGSLEGRAKVQNTMKVVPLLEKISTTSDGHVIGSPLPIRCFFFFPLNQSSLKLIPAMTRRELEPESQNSQSTSRAVIFIHISLAVTQNWQCKLESKKMRDICCKSNITKCQIYLISQLTQPIPHYAHTSKNNKLVMYQYNFCHTKYEYRYFHFKNSRIPGIVTWYI